jgi:VIT1/CCC1 family predicted Fe2+/Mn2+ transporter
MPMLAAVLAPTGMIIPVVTVASLFFLGVLGVVGAKAGGANIWRAGMRVVFWGALAMAITAGIGKLVGTSL